MALTDVQIRAIKPKDRIFKCSDARGLYLEVRPNGSKLWRCKYTHLGKDKRIALGRYPEVGLAEARRKRDEARRQLHDGIDPVTERKREKLLASFAAANTFGDVAKEYIDKMVREGRADTTTAKANWLLEQLAPIGKLPVAELKPVEVLGALKRIEAKGKYETARRCRSFASRVFRYAVATGRAEIDPTSVLRGALVTPKATHHAAILDPDAVGALLRSIDAYSGHLVTRIAMQVSPHVMARPGELRQAAWQEFDLEKAVWKIPPERMKMRRPHAVPLSRQVRPTPFRYGYTKASRFRRANERPGIFYASEYVATAVAETAYWRLLFFSRSPGFVPPTTVVEHSAFTVPIAVDRALDLTAPPFDAQAARWMKPDDWRATVAFGRDHRLDIGLGECVANGVYHSPCPRAALRPARPASETTARSLARRALGPASGRSRADVPVRRTARGAWW